MPFVTLSTVEHAETHIRNRLRQWFDASGETLAEAAHTIEWTPEDVDNYFAGKRPIDFVRCLAWTKHYGKTTDDLLAKEAS